jgi:Flp pilus assembly protein protease CpaA
MAIGVYDLKHKIIPDMFVYSFSALSLLYLLLTSEFSELIGFPHILNLLAGPIIALPLYLLWKISSGRWIGLGDSKLALGIGWFLGFSGGISAIIIGFWIGAIVGVYIS